MQCSAYKLYVGEEKNITYVDWYLSSITEELKLHSRHITIWPSNCSLCPAHDGVVIISALNKEAMCDAYKDM